MIHVFLELRNILSRETLRSVYFALVQSQMIYGIVAWGGATAVDLKPLLSVQKTIVRVITRYGYRSRSESYFNDLRVLKFEKLRLRSLILFSDSHRDRFPKIQHGKGTRGELGDRYQVPKLNTSSCQRNWVFLSPTILNILESGLEGRKLKKWVNENISSSAFSNRFLIVK